MAGIIDKIKGMLGGKKAPAATSGQAAPMGASKMDALKDKAGDVKDKVDVMVDKAGDKIPDKVKDTYEKVSDKVEGIIPGDKDGDGN
jgi:hypothetical protein